MRRAILFLSLVSAPAFAQTPNALVQFADPPENNGAPATVFNRHILWNSGKLCVQRPVGTAWECFATGAEVAATYMPASTANAALATLSGRVDAVEAQVATAQSTATAAQTSATSAASAASSAQATASSAQTSASTNASALTALTTRVTAAETALAALQALPKRACTTFSVAAGVSVPLTGISSVQNVTLAGVPVSAVCDTGAPSRMPLGARPDPVVTTAGTVAMAFVSNAGLLSSVISIPSGTYRLCCDL